MNANCNNKNISETEGEKFYAANSTQTIILNILRFRKLRFIRVTITYISEHLPISQHDRPSKKYMYKNMTN